MKILLVDDHQLFLEGISQILQCNFNAIEVLKADSVIKAIDIISSVPQIDLALVDLAMPDADGLSFLKQAKVIDQTLPIAVLSASDHIQNIKLVLSEGAQGFIPKTYPPKQLIIAINTILSGAHYLPPDIESRLVQMDLANDQAQFSAIESHDITERQLEVLSLLAKGLTNQKIAKLLFISEHTVKSHVKQLFQKLDSDCRMDCVNQARELGLIVS